MSRLLIEFLGLPDEERWMLIHGPSGETLREHRKRLHDPRNLEAEPCCVECCDCAEWIFEDDSEE